MRYRHLRVITANFLFEENFTRYSFIFEIKHSFRYSANRNSCRNLQTCFISKIKNTLIIFQIKNWQLYYPQVPIPSKTTCFLLAFAKNHNLKAVEESLRLNKDTEKK